MKALSLWNPWATLMVDGHKRVETRSWDTKYTGSLLIHAAKKWDGKLIDVCLKPPFRSLLGPMGVPQEPHSWTVTDIARRKKGWDMHFGAIIGRVELKECVPMHSVINRPNGDIGFFEGWHNSVLTRWLFINATEHTLGDFSPGRFAWFCKNPVVFEKPIPFRGTQGLFDVPDELVKELS